MIGGALPSLLLDFQPPPKTPRRNWRNVLHQQRLEATLHQHRDANEQDDLGQEEAADSTPLTPHYTLVSSSTCNLTMSSMLFSPPPLPWPRYAKGPNDLTPISRPWQPNTIQTRPSTLTIRSLETTFVCNPGPGSGMLECRPSKAAVHGIADDSFSLETICCSARAIVTMKALADANGDTRNRDYKILKQGYPVQERLAKDLYRLAGVPEGLCGIPEFQTFLAALPWVSNKRNVHRPPSHDRLR